MYDCQISPASFELNYNYALFLAFDVIRRSKLKKLVIFLHSLSSLQAIDGFNIDNDFVLLIKKYSVQTKQGKTIA